MTERRIRVLVVEDSPTMRDLMVHLLAGDARFEVVGTAADGEEAVRAVERLRPDVVTMDFHLPKLDGLGATRRIMETRPTPIVVVSSSAARDEVAGTFRALEAGALAIVDKPALAAGEVAKKLLETVRLMAEVKVVRRWPQRAHPAAAPAAAPASTAAPRLVAIGASTGGPQVLQAILAGLPAAFPLPIAIVQHISPGFTDGFAEWLGHSAAVPVRVASHGMPLAAGCAYVAPEGAHLLVAADASGGGTLLLAADAPQNGHRPSVSRLFAAVADGFGAAAVGVLLSGMGRDGAAELKRMHGRGATTIVQSPETSVVPGMPGEAIKLGAASLVLAPEQIAETLGRLARRSSESPVTVGESHDGKI